MSEVEQQQPSRRWDKGRVEAFSDGVLAIAITLLVLEIKAPENLVHLRSSLLHEWPAYLAYVTSFFTVGSVWIAHHDLYTRLGYVDAVLMRLNLLLLMTAAFLPFPTGILAEALRSTDTSARTAVVLYGVTVVVIELLLRACVSYAASRPALMLTPTAGQARTGARRRGWRSISPTWLYGVAIIIGLFELPKLAAIVYLALGVRSVLVLDGDTLPAPREPAPSG